jgi:hypothetical protein
MSPIKTLLATRQRQVQHLRQILDTVGISIGLRRSAMTEIPCSLLSRLHRRRRTPVQSLC